MDWFPEPYPDETFYSVLVRLHRYLGEPPYASFARAISGRRHFVALCHLPCDLASVGERFGWSEERLEELIRSTTTYRYHTAFSSQRVRESALEQMKGKGASLQFTLGLSTFPVTMPKALQFCAACVTEMLSAKREAWWKRSHQLPGVVVCPEHGTWLKGSAIEITSANRHKLVSPEQVRRDPQANCFTASRSDPPPVRLLELAKLSRALLDAPPVPMGPMRHQKHYRCLLADRGLLRGTHHLRSSRIRAIVEQYWGDALDLVPGLSLRTEEGGDWIVDFLRNKRKLAPPAQHIILRTAFEEVGTVERPFGAPPWPCCNPLVDHFEKPVVTEHRLRRARGKLHGHFTCSCGYSYSRTRYPDGSIGRPFLRTFGPEAGRFLRQAARDGLSLRAKARAMQVDPKTVARMERSQLVEADPRV